MKGRAATLSIPALYVRLEMMLLTAGMDTSIPLSLLAQREPMYVMDALRLHGTSRRDSLLLPKKRFRVIALQTVSTSRQVNSEH